MVELKKETFVKAIYIMFCISFLFKIYNNSLTGITGGSHGGIWNLATIIIFVVSIVLICKLDKVRIDIILLFGILFSILSVANSFITAKEISFSFFYNIAIIPYYIFLIVLFIILGKKNLNIDETLKVYIVCFWILSIFLLYNQLLEMDVASEYYVVTDVYYLLNMLPFVLFTKKPVVRYTAIGMVAVLLILSGKRTGFIAFCVGVLVFFIIESIVNSNSKKNSQRIIITFITAVILVVILFIILSYAFKLSFFERIIYAFTNGESGRYRIWRKTVSSLKNSSVIELIFGHGIRSVPILLNSKNALAHCDFLEIVYDFGIFTLLFFVAFYVSLIIKAVRLIVTKNQYASSFAFCIVLLLFMSMFSNYIIEATFATYNMITIGFILGATANREYMYGRFRSI